MPTIRAMIFPDGSGSKRTSSLGFFLTAVDFSIVPRDMSGRYDKKCGWRGEGEERGIQKPPQQQHCLHIVQGKPLSFEMLQCGDQRL